MKRPQWITLVIAIVLVTTLYLFGKTVPSKKPVNIDKPDNSVNTIPTDSVLAHAKRKLSAEQVVRINALENSIVRGDVKEQQLKVYHQLAHFWADTAQIFEPYAWYEAEAARLENSEKNLTFAAHLFLKNLRDENDPALRTWEAFQAKDLFERSLRINPQNDSSTVGLGACYLFGGISETPMEGILKVRAVAERDSTNVFAQEVLGQGSMMSGQYDKAIPRFESVYRLSQGNVDMKLEACLMLAEAFEKTSDNESAIKWYGKSLQLIKNEEIKGEVRKRMNELSKGLPQGSSK